MPTYQMSAPNGQTYTIDGPAGATDDQVRAEILRQHPDAGGAPAEHETFLQKAGRLISENYHAADQAYRSDMQAVHDKGISGQPLSVMDQVRPVLDAASAATSPIKGVADAAFGDRPVALPFGINSKGLTGGDIATFAVPAAGELSAARGVTGAAKALGVTEDAARTALAKPPKTIASPTVAGPVNALAAKVGDNLAAFDQAGVRPTIAAINPQAAKAAKFAAENAFVGGKTAANLQASLDDTAGAVQNVAGKYGASTSRDVAGHAVQQGISDFNDRFSKRAEAMYTPIFDKLGTAQEIAAQQAANAASLKTAQGAAPGVAEATIKPAATAQVLGEINARGNSPALRDLFSTPQLQKLTQAAQDPASLTFQDLRSARTWVREAQTDDSLRQGVSQSDLKRLEGSLTQDINANAASLASPRVARQLQQADQFYRLGSERIQGALQKFVGQSGDLAGEGTYDRIRAMASNQGGADVQRLQALKSSLKPSEWGDVAASVIDRMAQGKAGDFSVNSFGTNAGNLSDKGKDVLFGTGQLRRELDNLVRVAGMQKGVEQAANHSNTMVAGQVAGTVTGLLNPHTTIPTLVGLGALKITGEMLTNPEAVRWIARLGTAQAKSPQALSSAVGRLGAAARVTPALVPLYQQSVKLVQPQALPAAASATNQEPGTQ